LSSTSQKLKLRDIKLGQKWYAHHADGKEMTTELVIDFLIAINRYTYDLQGKIRPFEPLPGHVQDWFYQCGIWLPDRWVV